MTHRRTRPTRFARLAWTRTTPAVTSTGRRLRLWVQLLALTALLVGLLAFGTEAGQRAAGCWADVAERGSGAHDAMR